MPKQKEVGTSSDHSPVKHALMWEFVAREIRAAHSPKLHYIHRLPWLDLTAGDGVSAYDGPWHRTCSPGILAYHASTAAAHKPVWVALYEKNPETHEKLLASLAVELPLLGYKQVAEDQWQIKGRAHVRALNGDGHHAHIDLLHRNDAVLVFNDPNAITGWAMRPGFSNEIGRHDVRGLRVLSTLGCNVAGIKRAPLQTKAQETLPDAPASRSYTERNTWFDLISGQEAALPKNHDLLLAAFKRDASQWAYLMSIPSRPRWLTDAEADVRAAFATVQREPEMAWFRGEPDRFRALKDRLFLTQKELDERSRTPLPFEEVPRREGAE